MEQIYNYVNERQKIRHYRARSNRKKKKKKKNAKSLFFTSRSTYVNYAMLYAHSSVCNVLRLWSISLIPNYRVYRPYDTDSMMSV